MSVEEEDGALGIPPYKRCHLQSKTYQALVPVFSRCNQFRQKSLYLPIQSQQASKEGNNTNVDRFVRDFLEVEEGEIFGFDNDQLTSLSPVDTIKVDEPNVEKGQVSIDCTTKQGEKEIDEKVVLSNIPIAESKERRSWLDYSDIYRICDAGPSKRNEVKKAGVMTEKRRESKKRNKRRKRAEKDKKSGVKRLKLQPISKPTEVKYCKYYLQGNCHQGDSCKYSHDIKKPEFCKYFLSNCLKGADCPYDHDPFKYPCHNYQSEGFCSRGAACLFSHNVPPANGSYPASAVKQKAVKNLTLQSSANSATQLNKHGSTSQQTLNMSKIMSPKTPVSLETITKQPVPSIAQTPIGINFLNFVNVQFSDIRKQPNGESLPLVGGNATSICSEKRSVSEKFPNSNETLGRMSSSTAPMCQSSTMITKGNDLCNSALKALVSTSQLAEYECKTIDQSVQSTASNVIIPTVSSIMQELLFCGQ